jgi:broad specificity phosphatase PhoE
MPTMLPSRHSGDCDGDACRNRGDALDHDLGARVDRVIAPARAIEGDVALFAHGHVLRVLAARWLGLPAGARQHFLLDTGTLWLGYYRDIPAVRICNGPLVS